MPRPIEIVTNGTDMDLAARVGSRDRGALEDVFNLYSGAVKAIASRVLRDDALAEDVVQDTFVTFWKSPEKYDSNRGSLRTFLITIAHRRAVDIVRSEVARTQREQRPPDPNFSDDVEEEVWSRSLSEEVRQALERLSSDERDAITLAYYGGLSYVEVAKRLGQPEGTVKSRIRIAMRKLAGELTEVGL